MVRQLSERLDAVEDAVHRPGAPQVPACGNDDQRIGTPCHRRNADGGCSTTRRTDAGAAGAVQAIAAANRRQRR